MLAVAALGIAAGMIVMFASSRPSEAASARYCQAVCSDSSSAACFERCRGNDQQKHKKIVIKLPPPTDEPPAVLKSMKQPDWMVTVFEPKGGGGSGGGGGGGNGR